jgi:AcrR family transcriptional regulator
MDLVKADCGETEHGFSILNVGTAKQGRASSDDLTAQARIRNAAIAEFASAGFAKANVRDIAAAAGVSAALVIHHFGSKAGLREVCDQYVLQVILQRAREDAQPTSVTNGLRDYLANPSQFHEQVNYMARAIDEDSPSADLFVEALVAESESILRAGIADGSVRPTADVRAMSVLTLLNSMALLTMPPAIARALGQESLNPEVMRRMAMPSLELYTHGAYTDDTVLRSIQDALNSDGLDADADADTTTEPGKRND